MDNIGLDLHKRETQLCILTAEGEVVERRIRTLKEECLYLHDFATLNEARQVIGEFIERYNRQWLLKRHGHRTPTEVRASLTRQAA